jgi:hypothetical protein
MNDEFGLSGRPGRVDPHGCFVQSGRDRQIRITGQSNAASSPALKPPCHDRRSLHDIERLEPSWPGSFAQAQVTDVATQIENATQL